MATEHSGQTGVVTVASSHGLRHCPWKRCAQGMSCVSTRPRRQKGHRALDTEDSVRARFGGRNEGAGASRTKSSNKPPSAGCDEGDEPAESTVTARARSAAEAKARTSCAARLSSSS